jgi:hypothetical protein
MLLGPFLTAGVFAASPLGMEAAKTSNVSTLSRVILRVFDLDQGADYFSVDPTLGQKTGLGTASKILTNIRANSIYVTLKATLFCSCLYDAHT